MVKELAHHVVCRSVGVACSQAYLGRIPHIGFQAPAQHSLIRFPTCMLMRWGITPCGKPMQAFICQNCFQITAA